MLSIFDGLITSKTRIRILMRLFFNPARHAYLRELATEFDLSSSQVSEELKHLHGAGLLDNRKNGRQIQYRANTDHPLFPELHSMVKKALGMDRILDSVVSRLGNLEKAYLLDDYAEGNDNGLIDLMLVGQIDQGNLADLVAKTEKYVDRKIRTIVLTSEEYGRLWENFSSKPYLQIWNS
jgi:hypothetical protein